MFSIVKRVSKTQKIKNTILKNNLTGIEKYSKYLSEKAYDGSSFLHFAVSRQKIEMVKKILPHTNINDSNGIGMTPLHFAAQNTKLNMVNLLLKSGANPNQVNMNRQLPLHIAAKLGNTRVCKKLAKVSNLNAQDADGKTPLYHACENNRSSVVKILVSAGANLELTKKNGYTAIMIASKKGYYNIVKILAENGAEHKKNQCIHFAAKRGHPNVLSILLEHDTPIDLKCELYGMTPLHNACQYGQYESTALLIENGADLNSLDNVGNTPLHFAMHSKHIDLVRILLQRGASTDGNYKQPIIDLISYSHKMVKVFLENGFCIDQTNNIGRTLLHEACTYGRADTVKALLKNDAPTEATDIFNNTPLSLAVNRNNIKSVELLLSHGANPNVKSEEDASIVLITAVAMHRYPIVKLLLEYNAKVDVVDNEGRTALHHACLESNIDMIYLLLSYQASTTIPDLNNITPIDIAIEKNNEQMLKMFDLK